MPADSKPCTTLAVMNQKGGVGKTTTCANLGAALAEHGKNVCLIDLDPQAHLTINFGIDVTPDADSLYDLLLGEATFLETVRTLDKFPQTPGNVAVLPGSIDLAAVEGELAKEQDRHRRLSSVVDNAEHDFDYFLLDCPPSLGLLTLNALALADEVLIPMQPHFFALQGFAKLLETVELVRAQLNPKLAVGGVVLTMFDAQTKLAGEVVEELQQFIDSARGTDKPWANAQIFDTRVRRNIKLAESPSFGEPITVYDTSSNGATDYRALAREVLQRHGRLQPEPEARPELEARVNPAVDPDKLRAAHVSRPERPEHPTRPARSDATTPFGV